MENQPQKLPDRTRVWQQRESSPASSASDRSQYREPCRLSMESPTSPPLKRKRGVVDLSQLLPGKQYQENPCTPPNSQSCSDKLDDDFAVRPLKRQEFEIGPQDSSPYDGSDCSDDYGSVLSQEWNSDAEQRLESLRDLIHGMEASMVKPPVLYYTWKYKPTLCSWRVGKSSKRIRAQQGNTETKDGGNATTDKKNSANGNEKEGDPTNREHKKKKRQKEQEEKDWAEARRRARQHWICHVCREGNPSVIRVYHESTLLCRECDHSHEGCVKCPGLGNHFEEDIVQYMYDQMR
ncbi:hypothetical protein ONS95_013687 [Cadophora gregata]|uniref:uncharacterized protein n=1 Tax=Cadophora gregata TaxID=51156 RepID=UPI0026DB3243|nr:uncharacterized protein ONS95_013687 [Cadophora gregata]KAK0113429.1 hypothetical protein ONS96_014295 [Cadophora gregata f. sp. sojae]KAK0114187.1 hypothetical protein ONS95_013687 [Cadophora gregata]